MKNNILRFIKNNILRFIKNNRLRIGLSLIIISYGGFFTYFCMAKPCEPNDTVIEQKEDAILENTPVSGEENPTVPKGGMAKTVGPVYLSEITAFYERVIAILFGTIGILLVLSFGYIHLTSKKQAEDIAGEALETKSFQITLKHLIATGADEFINRYSEMPNLEKRIEFLEEQANIKGYELSDDPSNEVNDGNN